MGSTQKPQPPEPDPSPDRNPDFEDPRLPPPGSESPDFAENRFPDHAPLPLNDESAAKDEYKDNSTIQRDFYRATSDPEVHHPYVPKQRVKVRRKNQKSVPEWERGEGSQDDASSPVDSSPSRRGRRKSKPQSKWSKILGATPKLFIYFAAFLIAGILVTGLLQILGKKNLPPTESPQTSALTSDSAGIMDNFLTEGTRKRVEATLDAYFAAENWEAKLPLLRDPERVRPLMEDWYNRPENLGTDIPAKVSYPPEYQKQIPIGGRTFVMFAVMVEPENRIQFCTVEQVNAETYQVDWEATESYQKVPLKQFLQDQPQSPTPFRVFIRETNFYNGQFEDPARFRAFSLTNPADPDFKLWAYVERGTPLEEELDLLLPPLVATSAILNLAYPENSNSDDQVVIKSIAHPNWFY